MIRTSKNDIIWNYTANILNIGVSIVILPLILKMLSPDEVGLWYVFLSISSLALLLDFGFSTTLMRHISYAVSGASEILSEGIPEKSSNEPNYSLVKSIVKAAKGIYRFLSVISLILLFIFGTFYIVRILKVEEVSLIAAWGIYAFASGLNILSIFWIPILKGSGAIKAANKVTIFSKLTFLVLAAIGLGIGGGLVLLTTSYLVSIILIWIWAQFELNAHLGINYKHSIPSDNYKLKDVLIRIWPNSRRSGLVNIGAWLTTKGSTLISSYYLGLEITGQFGISLQLFTVVGNISSLLFNSYLPELTSTRTTRNFTRFRQLFSRSILIQWSMTFLGNIGVVFVVPFLLKFLGMSTELLPLGWLLTLSVIMFLEQNHSTFAVLITLSNHVPFVPSSLISGFSIIIVSTILASLGYGIGSIILTQGLIQLSFNNWYWPYLVFKQNSFKLKDLISYAK